MGPNTITKNVIEVGDVIKVRIYENGQYNHYDATVLSVEVPTIQVGEVTYYGAVGKNSSYTYIFDEKKGVTVYFVGDYMVWSLSVSDTEYRDEEKVVVHKSSETKYYLSRDLAEEDFNSFAKVHDIQAELANKVSNVRAESELDINGKDLFGFQFHVTKYTERVDGYIRIMQVVSLR